MPWNRVTFMMGDPKLVRWCLCLKMPSGCSRAVFYNTLYWDIIRLSPCYPHDLTLISVPKGNFIHHKVWDTITYQFPTSTGQLLKFGHRHVISSHTYWSSDHLSMSELQLIYVSKWDSDGAADNASPVWRQLKTKIKKSWQWELVFSWCHLRQTNNVLRYRFTCN